MFCNKCGYQLNDNSAFCTNCGASVDPSSETYSHEPSKESKKAVRENDAANQIFVWAIIGIVCSIFISGYLGLIFSIIAAVKAKKYRLVHGQLHGKAKTGKTLATVGIIIGIITACIVTLLLAFGILMLLASVGLAFAPLAFLYEVGEMTGLAYTFAII